MIFCDVFDTVVLLLYDRIRNSNFLLALLTYAAETRFLRRISGLTLLDKIKSAGYS